MIPRNTAARWAACGLMMICLAVAPRSVAADDPPPLSTADLVALVSSDAALCVEIPEAEEQWKAFLQSPLVDRLKALPLYQQWRSGDEYRKLEMGRAAVESVLGKPLGQFGREMFGEAVVLAAYPTQEGHFAGVLLTKADSPQALQETVAVWERTIAGTTEELTHRGQTYFHRVAAGGRRSKGKARSFYYHIRQNVLIFSDRQSPILTAIDLHAGTSGTDDSPSSLISHAGYRQARAAIADDAAVRLFINTPVWTARLEATDDHSKLRRLLPVLRSTGWLAVGLRQQLGIVVDVVAELKPEQASRLQWLDLLEVSDGPSPGIPAHLPPKAVFAVFGHANLQGLDQLIVDRLPPAARPRWQHIRAAVSGLLSGRDPIDDVAAKLPGDFSAWLIDHSRATGRELPLDGVLAISLPVEQNQADKPSLASALDNALRTTLHVIAATAEGKSVPQLHSRQADHRTIRWLETGTPWSPTFSVDEKQLILGSHPDPLERIAQPGATPSGEAGFWDGLRESFADSRLAVMVNTAQLRKLIAEHRGYFLQDAQKSDGLGPEEAEQHVARMEQILSLSDGAFAAFERETAHRLRFRLGVVSAPVTPE